MNRILLASYGLLFLALTAHSGEIASVNVEGKIWNVGPNYVEIATPEGALITVSNRAFIRGTSFRPGRVVTARIKRENVLRVKGPQSKAKGSRASF